MRIRLVFTDERLRLLVGACNGQTGVIPGQKSAWGKFEASLGACSWLRAESRKKVC